MNENDWWNDLYGAAGPGDEAGGTTVAQAPESIVSPGQQAVATVSPALRGTATSAPRIPTPAHRWGSGHAPDQFLQDNPPHGHNAPGSTPEEAAELRRHQERLAGPGPMPIPPKPTAAPTVPTAADETSLTPETDEKKSEKQATTEEKKDKSDTEEGLGGVKALLAAFRAKGGQVGEKTAPARAGALAAARAVSPANSGRWSFLWSMGAAWSVSLQSLVALYDNTVSLLGLSKISTGTDTGWHLFEGPGHWFRDIWQAAWETGEPTRLLFLASIGVLPLALHRFAERIKRDGLRKAVGWIAYGVPVFWISSNWYIHSFGFRSWDDLYLTGLAAASWLGFWASRDEEATDFQKFLCLIPLASMTCGVIAYSPGAAF